MLIAILILYILIHLQFPIWSIVIAGFNLLWECYKWAVRTDAFLDGLAEGLRKDE